MHESLFFFLRIVSQEIGEISKRYITSNDIGERRDCSLARKHQNLLSRKNTNDEEYPSRVDMNANGIVTRLSKRKFGVSSFPLVFYRQNCGKPLLNEIKGGVGGIVRVCDSRVARNRERRNNENRISYTYR